MDVKEEALFGEAVAAHWYYIAKGRALRDWLKGFYAPCVLDIGAGSGIFSKQLLDAGICDRAVCVDMNYAQPHEEMHHGKLIAFVREAPPLAERLVLMMDVLEHVDDAPGLLRQYTQNMDAQSRVVITVPAFPFLWSGHDVFLEHKRRYTMKSLQAAVEEAGLEVVRMRYFFGLLFLPVAVMRILRNLRMKAGTLEPKSEMKLAPGWLNSLLVAVHEMERKALFPVNRLGGITLFCMCKKRCAN